MGDRGPGAWEVLAPAPADAPVPPDGHFKLGSPAGTWTYRDIAGALLGHVLRFDLDDGAKAFYPLTWCRHTGTGRSEWRWKSWSAPRPLYNLDALAARPDAPILVVEGEKSADAATKLLFGYVATTSPNGSAGAFKANWSVLAQRSVVIWPDSDEAGRRYAGDVAKALAAVGAVEVRIVISPEGLG